MLGVFAEFETNLRRERQLEGINAAKARGVYKGRKPSIDAAEVFRLRREEGLSGRRRSRAGSVLAEQASIACSASTSLQVMQLGERMPIKTEMREPKG
jgi:DNA invertase Pin-like site-specific DNA recombinase